MNRAKELHDITDKIIKKRAENRLKNLERTLRACAESGSNYCIYYLEFTQPREGRELCKELRKLGYKVRRFPRWGHNTDRLKIKW